MNEPTEERLRSRISIAMSAYTKGDLPQFSLLFTKRARQEIEETETIQEQREANRKYKEFAQKMHPIVSLVAIELQGTTARARMQHSVLTADGSRLTRIYYDHWVFENGDWYIDKTNRSE